MLSFCKVVVEISDYKLEDKLASAKTEFTAAHCTVCLFAMSLSSENGRWLVAAAAGAAAGYALYQYSRRERTKTTGRPIEHR